MNYGIVKIEGIGPAFAEKLAPAGIRTTGDFLKLCANRKGRQTIATQTGISEKLILKWANLADLMRIKGIGPQFSELLEAAGVDTVKELKTRRPDNLAARMVEVNAAKKLTRTVPAQSLISRWVAAAKEATPTITH